MSPEVSWLKQLADVLAQAGPYGVIAVLVYVVRLLYATIAERDATIASLQDKRASDANENTKALATALTASTMHVSTNSSALADVSRLQQAGLDILRLMPKALEDLNRGLERTASKLDDVSTGRGGGR